MGKGQKFRVLKSRNEFSEFCIPLQWSSCHAVVYLTHSCSRNAWVMFGWIYPDAATRNPLKNCSSSPKWTEYLHHSISHLMLFRLDCRCKFLEGPFNSAFLLRPKIPVQGNSWSQFSLLAVRITCPWGSVFLMDVASGTDYCIFYTSVKVLHFYYLVLSWDATASVWICTKPVCKRCFCFTLHSGFESFVKPQFCPFKGWFNTSVVVIVFLLVGLSGPWCDICETWTL